MISKNQQWSRTYIFVLNVDCLAVSSFLQNTSQPFCFYGFSFKMGIERTNTTGTFLQRGQLKALRFTTQGIPSSSQGCP